MSVPYGSGGNDSGGIDTPVGIGTEVLWWMPSIDDTAVGTEMLNDLSGNTHHATWSASDNVVWVADDRLGGTRAIGLTYPHPSLESSSIDDLLLASGRLRDVVTLCFWAARSPGTSWLTFGQGHLQYSLIDNLARFYLQDSVASPTVSMLRTWTLPSSALDDDWHHYIFSVAASDTNIIAASLHVDSVLVTAASGSLTGPPNVNDPGAFAVNGGDVLFDDVRLFHSSLTSAQRTLLAGSRSGGVALRSSRSSFADLTLSASVLIDAVLTESSGEAELVIEPSQTRKLAKHVQCTLDIESERIGRRVTFAMRFRDDVTLPPLHRSPIVVSVRVPVTMADATIAITRTRSGVTHSAPAFVRDTRGDVVTFVFFPWYDGTESTYDVTITG